MRPVGKNVDVDSLMGNTEEADMVEKNRGVAKVRFNKRMSDDAWIHLIKRLVAHNFEIIVCSRFAEKAMKRKAAALKTTERRRVHLEEFGL